MPRQKVTVRSPARKPRPAPQNDLERMLRSSKRRKPRKHEGVTVDTAIVGSAYCAGTSKCESEKELAGYAIRSPSGFVESLDLCRACAMQLALKIFELESL